jgi:D-sedoheptulose 7-phosphate isomerase
MSFTTDYLDEAALVLSRIDPEAIDRLVELLARVRGDGGRLFVLGVGGSAANASHAVNDFRKIAGFEAYCPTDNVAELTARVNDEGWEGAFAAWLRGSRLTATDAVLVLSVGGLVPTVNAARVTPHAEAFQAVVWHLLVSHPLLRLSAGRWESVAEPEPVAA